MKCLLPLPFRGLSRSFCGEKRSGARRSWFRHRRSGSAKWQLLAAAASLSMLGFLGVQYLGPFENLELSGGLQDNGTPARSESHSRGRASSASPTSGVDFSAASTAAALPPVPVTEPETAEGIIEEGVRLLEHLTQRFPDQPDVHELQARLHDWMDNTPQAVEAWQRCLKLDPSYAYAYEGLASVAAKRGEHEKAIALYRRAVALNPRSAPSRVQLAEALLALGEADKAVTLLQETASSFPEATDAHYQLGIAHQQRGEFAEAKRSFEQTLDLEPRYAAAQIGLARAAMQLGLEEEARQHEEKYKQLSARDREGSRRNRLQFDDVQATGQDVAEIYTDAGRIYLAQGEPAAAELVWRRAAILDPQDLNCRQALVWLYAQQGDHAKAVRRLREMTDLGPGDPAFQLEMARFYAQMDRVEEAENLLKTICETAPDEPAAHAELAKLYLRMDRRFPEALRLAQRAVELAPTAEHYVLLSGCYERNRNRAKAAEAMAEASRRDPQNIRYRQMHEAFQQQMQQQQEP